MLGNETAIVGVVHEPVKVVKAKPRRKLLAYERLKVLLLLSIWVGFGALLKHSSKPTIGWTDSIREAFAGKWWVFVIGGLEILRQVHYFISEKSGKYHQFWVNKVWGAWDRYWSKRNPWLRFRLARMVKRAFWSVVVIGAFSSLWGVSFLQGVGEAPRRFFYNPFGSQQPWFFQLLFVMGIGVLQFVAIFWFMSRGGVETHMPEDIKTRFSDVWGQDAVLEKIRENVIFLNKPEAIEKRGGHVPGGILLYGPPGTGKTLMAEAVAGETSKPFVFVEPGAFKAMFVGVGVMKVKALYKKLRKLSLRYGGVIVFFDEADTLGNRGGAVEDGHKSNRLSEHPCNGLHYASAATHRMLAELNAASAEPETAVRRGGRFNVISGMGMGGAMDGSLQAVLAEMSGLRKPKSGFWRWMRTFLTMPPPRPPKYRILTVMATNMPDSLDPALLRPGRVDRKYHVNYPLLEGRVKTFEGYLKKVRHEITPQQIERLATMLPRLSGAAIKDIVNESLIAAMRHGRDYVSWSDIFEAGVFKMHGVPDGTATTLLKQYEAAVHEACHAVATYRLRTRDSSGVATIEKGGAVGGFVSWVPVEERDFSWKSEMEIDVICAVASLAGERLFFGNDSSQRVVGDLATSTMMVTAMLNRAGMGDTIASRSGSFDGHGPKRMNDSDEKVEAYLQVLYQRAVALLNENDFLVLAIAHALVSRRTITGEDITAIEQGAMGSSLDGRWYHNAINQDALRWFHRSALEAHNAMLPHAVLTLPPLPPVGSLWPDQVLPPAQASTPPAVQPPSQPPPSGEVLPPPPPPLSWASRLPPPPSRLVLPAPSPSPKPAVAPTPPPAAP
jgi:cell division protease FtsH